ncbi:MAG: hypothetical protein U0L42_10220, partial [Methanobrevibacter sp.]|uniref:hypothetical protein n=1 Tax=Methanobrevibacter sp. TaxID=66852 RepID=UPI002E76E77C
LIFHINNNCELVFTMIEDDDGVILVSNSNGFSDWYDDDYTLGKLFNDMYKHCSLYVKKCKKYLIENIKMV